MKVGLTIGVRRLPQDKRPMPDLYRDCIETSFGPASVKLSSRVFKSPLDNGIIG